MRVRWRSPSGSRTSVARPVAVWPSAPAIAPVARRTGPRGFVRAGFPSSAADALGGRNDLRCDDDALVDRAVAEACPVADARGGDGDQREGRDRRAGAGRDQDPERDDGEPRRDEEHRGGTGLRDPALEDQEPDPEGGGDDQGGAHAVGSRNAARALRSLPVSSLTGLKKADGQRGSLLRGALLGGTTALLNFASRHPNRFTNGVIDATGSTLNPVDDVAFRELTVAGSLPARLYGEGDRLLVYFHGGGFVLGSLVSHAAVAQVRRRDDAVQGAGRRLPDRAAAPLPGRVRRRGRERPVGDRARGRARRRSGEGGRRRRLGRRPARHRRRARRAGDAPRRLAPLPRDRRGRQPARVGVAVRSRPAALAPRR